MLGNPQCMEGSQYKREPSSSHAEIETILKNLQESINAHDNRITDEGVRMGEFSYASFGDLKYDVLRKIP